VTAGLRLAAERAELQAAPRDPRVVDLTTPTPDERKTTRLREHQDYHRGVVSNLRQQIAEAKRIRRDSQTRIKKARAASKALLDETIAKAKKRHEEDSAILRKQEEDALALEAATLQHDEILLRASEAALKVLEAGAE
jgi:hypothetical protein